MILLFISIIKECYMSELVVMLTYNDQTVKNAIEVFDSVKDLDVKYWGFKNVGLPVSEMKILVEKMKTAGKFPFLEVVSYDEPTCLEAAILAIDCQFSGLMGTLYFPSVGELVKGKIKYYPFCGHVWDRPSVLGDSIEGIIEDARRLQSCGCDGTDLLAYRFVGDKEELISRFTKELPDFAVCIAGSVSSYERIEFVCSQKPWSFTMGTALFDKKFVPEGDFRENLIAVTNYLKTSTV